MAIAAKLDKDFQFLNADLEKIEGSVSSLAETDKGKSETGLRAFVGSVRLLYEARHSWLRDEQIATHDLIEGIHREKVEEENILPIMLGKMRSGRQFSPSDLVKQIRGSFDLFLKSLNLLVRYRPDDEKSASQLGPRFSERIRLMKSLRSIFGDAYFEDRFDAGKLESLKIHLTALSETRYPDLKQELERLFDLLKEFDSSLLKLYSAVMQLEMFKDADMNKVNFLRKIIRRIFRINNDNIVQKGLSDGDKTKIASIQNMVAKLHDTTIVSIRTRQKIIQDSLDALRQDETAVSRLIIELIGSKTRRIALKKAA